MKRLEANKTFLAGALVALAALLAGCSGAAVGNTGDLMISGQIQNWQASFGATLDAIGGPNEALGSGTVDEDGEFSVVVSPPFFTLGDIAPCDNDTSTLVSTPEALRVSGVKLTIKGQESSFVTRNASRGAPKEAIYAFADQPGTVQGQVECVGRYRNTYRFDLELVQGWTLILVSVEFVDEVTNEAIATYTSVEEGDVSTFEWYAYVP